MRSQKRFCKVQRHGDGFLSFEYKNLKQNAKTENRPLSYCLNDVYPNQSKKVYINPLFVIIPCVVLLCTGVGVYFIIRASKKRKINKQA